MEGVALLVAAVGCLLVLYVRPVYGLAVYTASSMWFPYYVGTVSVGSIDFSAGRIIIIASSLKSLFTADLTGGLRLYG